MRRILATTLIVVLFVNLFGYFIAFTAKQYKVKAEVTAALKAEKIKHTQQFVFTPAEYKQLDTREWGKEFCLNGNMYDVVEKREVDGNVILTAYYDHKETGLLTKFVSFFKNETESAGRKTKHLISFALLEFTLSSKAAAYIPEQKVFRLPVSSTSLQHTFGDTQSPPPDSVTV